MHEPSVALLFRRALEEVCVMLKRSAATLNVLPLSYGRDANAGCRPRPIMRCANSVGLPARRACAISASLPARKPAG